MLGCMMFQSLFRSGSVVAILVGTLETLDPCMYGAMSLQIVAVSGFIVAVSKGTAVPLVNFLISEFYMSAQCIPSLCPVVTV